MPTISINSATHLPRRPRVYFEEWNEPLITGIRWVAELIEIAGGDYSFPEHIVGRLAKDRILEDTSTVIERAPDIILGSWCGRKFDAEIAAARPGWGAIPAVQSGQMFHITSADILQPGPAALTDGITTISGIIHAWSRDIDSR